MTLRNKKVVITGASFIGVHLVHRLLNIGVSQVKVINKSSKHKKNLKDYVQSIEFIEQDLRDYPKTRKLLKGADVVFHLAADHGGRGYVALRQGNTATNFLLDGSVFRACLDNQVAKTFFASSGCVYPNFKQTDPNKKIFLKETDVTPPYDADNMYGWAKLMGEITLKQYYKDFGLKSAIGRFFTVYGPYAKESHAVIATIAKSFIRQDPFEVWGDGTQIRNWTYVDDIVSGIIKLTEKVENAESFNLGTSERITVNQMVKEINNRLFHNPKKVLYQAMPTGPLNRVADISKAYNILHWSPKYTFTDGVTKTIEWYVKTHNKNTVGKNLASLLI